MECRSRHQTAWSSIYSKTYIKWTVLSGQLVWQRGILVANINEYGQKSTGNVESNPLQMLMWGFGQDTKERTNRWTNGESIVLSFARLWTAFAKQFKKGTAWGQRSSSSIQQTYKPCFNQSAFPNINYRQWFFFKSCMASYTWDVCQCQHDKENLWEAAKEWL